MTTSKATALESAARLAQKREAAAKSAGERIIEGATEALAVARGEQPAARITIHGHAYVPATVLSSAQERIAELEGALRPFASVPKGVATIEMLVRWHPTSAELPHTFSLTADDFARAASTLARRSRTTEKMDG